ncbi:hypothetical protein Sjap_017701 [Stephania japonica]|uniref:Uncharacterized protein n=1 Tax=Stephania japonica TaxID=461633 RepID=A0AAP0I6M4_9MAGN
MSATADLPAPPSPITPLPTAATSLSLPLHCPHRLCRSPPPLPSSSIRFPKTPKNIQHKPYHHSVSRSKSLFLCCNSSSRRHFAIISTSIFSFDLALGISSTFPAIAQTNQIRSRFCLELQT